MCCCTVFVAVRCLLLCRVCCCSVSVVALRMCCCTVCVAITLCMCCCVCCNYTACVCCCSVRVCLYTECGLQHYVCVVLCVLLYCACCYYTVCVLLQYWCCCTYRVCCRKVNCFHRNVINITASALVTFSKFYPKLFQGDSFISILLKFGVCHYLTIVNHVKIPVKNS